jgi:hypothetical protein
MPPRLPLILAASAAVVVRGLVLSTVGNRPGAVSTVRPLSDRGTAAYADSWHIQLGCGTQVPVMRRQVCLKQ